VAIRSVMGLYAATIYAKIIALIESGREYSIGGIKLTQHGIQFERGLIFTKSHMITWGDARAELSSGDVFVVSASNRNARTSLSCRNTWNACLLPTLIEIMQSYSK
jgi:hypothetical protein